MGKPIHSRHDNGVPLNPPLSPSIFCTCIGIVCTVNRAVLQLFVALYVVSVRHRIPTVYDTGMVGIVLAVLPVERNGRRT